MECGTVAYYNPENKVELHVEPGSYPIHAFFGNVIWLSFDQWYINLSFTRVSSELFCLSLSLCLSLYLCISLSLSVCVSVSLSLYISLAFSLYIIHSCYIQQTRLWEYKHRHYTYPSFCTVFPPIQDMTYYCSIRASFPFLLWQKWERGTQCPI